MQTFSIRALFAFPLCLAPFLAASVLVAPAQAQDLGGGCERSGNPTGQGRIDCPGIELEIEEQNGASLTQVKAKVIFRPDIEEDGRKLSITTVSEGARTPFDSDKVSLVYAGGEKQDLAPRRLVSEQAEEGPTVSMYWADLSAQSLRRLAGSETFRLEGGGVRLALPESASGSIQAQAEAVLEAR